MKRIFTVLTILLSAWAALAQNYTELNGPYGGELNDIINADGTLVAATSGQGIVTSNDNGVTWTEANNGISTYVINDLEFDASSSKIYALSYSKLYSSTDYGATWITVASSGFSDGFIFKKTSSHYFIVDRYSGKLYRSTTGAAWNLLYTISGANQITDFEVNAAGNLFITTYNAAVWRSTDNGNSFTQLDAGEGLTETAVYSLTISGSDIYALGANGPYKSGNNGNTWTSVLANLPAGNTYYSALIETNGFRTFIFNTNEVWSSSDGGTSWDIMSHPTANYGPNYYATPTAMLLQSSTDVLLSFDNFGTFRSTDGGNTWSEKNNGVTAFELYAPNSLHYASGSNRLFYAKSWPFGMYMSIDDGASWDFLSAAPHDKNIVGFKQVGTTLLAYGDGINQSTDNGVNWTETTSGLVGACFEYFNTLVVGPSNTLYSYSEYDCTTGSGYYLLKSTDVGVTWTKNPITGLPATSYVQSYNMHIDSNGDLYLLIYNYAAGVNKAELYRVNPTTFTTVKITNLPTTSPISDVESYNGKIYVLTNNNQLHYAAEGATWTTKTTTSGFGNIRVINETTFYILNSTGAIISTDGGNSWANTGSFGYSRSAHEVVISPSNYSYISVDNAKVQKSNSPVIPPSAPTGLSVIGTRPTSVALKFNDNSNNEEYFIVETSEGNNTNYDSVANWTRPDFHTQAVLHRFVSSDIDNGVPVALKPSTTYYFRVRAKGAGGKSAYSNEVSVTTPASCSGTTTPVPLNRSWTATSSTGSNPTVGLTGGTSFTIPTIGLGAAGAYTGSASIGINCLETVVITTTGAVPNGNGTWNPTTNVLTVKWQNGSTLAPFQETVTYTLNATDPAPSAPTGLGVYVKTQNEIVVSWLNSQYAQTYQVQRSTTSGGGFVNIGSPVSYPNTTYVDNFTFTPGTTYYYKIIATSNGGGTATSSEVSIQMQVPVFDAVSLPGYDLGSQGIAWIDFDNDSDEDLLVSPFNGTDVGIVPYENLGNGSFQQISLTGVSEIHVNTSRTIAVGDINNDNQLDFITNAGSDIAGGDMFINSGNKTFTRTALVPAASNGQNWFASLADFNNDGRLDAVFSLDDATVSPQLTHYKFFTQNGSGSFDPYEIGEIAAETSTSRGGSWADIDNDGDQDFLRTRFGATAADYDQLFINNADGTFTPATGTAFETDANMTPRTVSWGDFDNDLDLDVFVGHNGSGLNNMLYQNNADGTFTRLTTSLPAEAKAAGVSTFGSSWADFDNDGDLDLAVANTTQCALYLNTGTGTFTKFSGTEYLVASDASRTNVAFAVADYDKNGTMDIATGKSLVSVSNFPTILLKNSLVPGTNSKWLEVKLRGTTSNAAGIGARIIITTPDSKKQMRVISAHTGYGSCNSLIAHFGLKSQSSANIEVRWPSGIIQTLSNQTANQILTIVEDGAGPAVTNRLPINGAPAASTATLIAVELDESSTAQVAKKLYLYKAGDPTPVFSADLTTATKTAVGNGHRYQFTLPAKLLPNTDYYITVDAGAFKDSYGNASLEIAAGSWTFKTIAAPVPTGLAPTHSSSNIAASTTLAITFNRTVTAASGKTVKLYKSTDGATPVRTMNAQSGVIAGNTITFTITPKLERATTYNVVIDAAAFIDTESTDYAGMTSGNWTFTTDPGPALSSVLPASGATNVANNAALEINFNKSVTAVAGKKLKVMNGTNAIVDIDVSTTGDVAGGKYTYTPTANWPYLALLNVVVDAGAFVDASQNDFVGIAQGDWSFRIIEEPDTQAPTINAQTIAPSLNKNFLNSQQTFTVTDNKQVNIVKLFARKISGSTYTEFTLSPGTGGSYSVTLQESTLFDGIGMEYYITASDLAGNTARAPGPAGTSKIYLTYAETDAKIPSERLGVGGQRTTWKIFSIPFTLTGGNNAIESVFNELTDVSSGLKNKVDYRILRYSNATKWDEYPNHFTTIERGRGYFINIKNSIEISIGNNLTAPSNDRSNLFSMSLQAGWNMVGNPYLNQITWTNVATFNGLSGDAADLKKYTGSGYSSNATLAPFEGGFIYTETAIPNLVIPFDGQTSPGGRKDYKDLGNDITADEWIVKLNLMQQEFVYEFGSVGMALDASLSYDVYDGVTPPRFFDYLELNFSHPEHAARRFTRDVVPTQKNYTWEFTVDSNLDGLAELTWDDNALAGAPKDLYLLDISRQILVNMKETGKYSFNPKESANFRVYFGENLKIAPDRVYLGKAYPNPTAGFTTMGFSLPESGGTKQLVTLEIIDAMGRNRGTISQGTFGPGFHEVTWNAKELESGFYHYRLNVKGNSGTTSQVNKLVIK